MSAVAAIAVISLGAVLVGFGPWLAARLVWRDEGDRSSALSAWLGLAAGRRWWLHRLVVGEVVGLGFVAAGALVLAGVWDPTT